MSIDFYIVERSGIMTLSAIDNSWCRPATTIEVELWKYHECLEWYWFYEECKEIEEWLYKNNMKRILNDPSYNAWVEIGFWSMCAYLKYNELKKELRK